MRCIEARHGSSMALEARHGYLTMGCKISVVRNMKTHFQLLRSREAQLMKTSLGWTIMNLTSTAYHVSDPGCRYSAYTYIFKHLAVYCTISVCWSHEVPHTAFSVSSAVPPYYRRPVSRSDCPTKTYRTP